MVCLYLVQFPLHDGPSAQLPEGEEEGSRLTRRGTPLLGTVDPQSARRSLLGLSEVQKTMRLSDPALALWSHRLMIPGFQVGVLVHVVNPKCFVRTKVLSRHPRCWRRAPSLHHFGKPTNVPGPNVPAG